MHFFPHGTNSARGVAILITSRLGYKNKQIRSDNEGRVLNMLLEVDDHTLNLINVYAPSKDSQRRDFFLDLNRFLSDSNDNVMGGDFNCIFNSRLDKLGGVPDVRNSAVLVLNAVNTRFGLVDVWRERHKDERNFTWTGKDPRDPSLYIRTCIDFFFTCKPVNQCVTATAIQPYPHSDHDCLTLTMDFEKIERGPGYWHFNNKLLTDGVFQEEIERFWLKWVQDFDNFANPLEWWEKAKSNFKRIAIRRATIIGKIQRHERFVLQSRWEKLLERAKNGTTSDIEQYLLAKEALKQLELKELEANKIRSKAQFVEEGEKSTRFFFSLEKCRHSAQNIRVLTKNNMDTVTETRDLLGEAFSFYKQLYTAQPCDETIQAEFLEGAYPELVEEARDSCEGETTTEELKKAVDAMEKDKSPGLDGITTNFYKHFWHMLGDKLVQVYNCAFRVGHRSVSQRRGVISLLFKKGDRTQLKNWRPITLLTTDYKILSKALANRLHGVLPLIVHSDQTASIRGRTINDNARLLHDVISYANTNSVPLAAVSIDQMKAFDRVSHDFLFKCLKRFGFGPPFIQWIQILYTSVSSSVRVNGWLTAFVHLERGLRQGCPLSMPLYVLTAETMAINIRSNPLIHGVKPPKSQNEVKLSQFADDTTLLLTDEQSIIETFRVFDQYELASGAKINKSKCKGLWSGDFSDRTDQLFDFAWYNDYIPDKILGQFFGNVDCSLLNWNAKVQKIDNIIAAWRQRDLSYKGKALIINSLLTSSLCYNVTSLAVPPWVITHIEQAVYNVFWSNKHPLVNRELLALPLKEGVSTYHALKQKSEPLG